MEQRMRNRRDFIKSAAGATTGMLLTGHVFAGPSFQGSPATPGKRREIFIGGRRVKVVDVHAHCQIPEVWEIIKDTNLASIVGGPPRGQIVMGADRIQWRGEHGL